LLETHLTQIIAWILPCSLFLLAGLFTIKFLTEHPLRMSQYLALTFLTLFAGIWAGAALPEPGPVWLRVILFLACFFAGYLAAARSLLSRSDPRPLPQLRRRPGEPGDGHTAVIYFTHGEPETYDPIGWIHQFREFDEQKIRFVPFIARPLFIFNLRNHYLQVGTSGHRRMHAQMLKALEQEFRKSGDRTTRFYLCFLDDAPRPDAAVIQALNDGASRILVSEVFLTISNHTAEGEELIRKVEVEKYGATVAFTGPLWDSQALKEMFVQRALENTSSTDRSRVGVLLVGHGQPEAWDQQWPTETHQELEFRYKVLDLLEQEGYRKENLGLAWMEFRQPRVRERVESLSRNGVEKILYFAAAISADSLHSQYDIPADIDRARRDEHLILQNLGAWNDHPLVIRAIKEKIDSIL
jgi:protoheme ferro-lyase